MQKSLKKTSQVFILLFTLSFILINWNDISWVFNYKAWEGLAYGFFNPYQDSELLVEAQALVVAKPPTQPAGQTPPPPVHPSRPSSLSIPSIPISTPVVIAKSTDKKALMKDLDKGAVYYPGSVLPGQSGQIIILGHSAPPNWPRIKHDYIFSDIEDLTPGQQIILHFNDTQYVYKVLDKQIVKQGEEVGTAQLTGTNNILTLVSCWPPGKDYLRIAVNAELVT